jgi:MSHA biogenesis protein MshM
MYLNHFQLTEKPFSLTPDTQFYLAQQSHTAAFNMLIAALKEGEGFIKIVGEVGTGKTLLCRKLLSSLDPQKFVSAYIPNPSLTPKELKACIAQELGAPIQKTMSGQSLTTAIYSQLIDYAHQGKKVVLIVDETQAMPKATVESLRLLTNLETEKNKLLQVVIFGQPELDVLLSRRDLRQFKQRIMFSETLRPFDFIGVCSYIRHRLASCGCNDPHLFSVLTMYLLAKGSRGIPRLINILAHKALICCYAEGATRVHMAHVAKAIADTPECSLMGKSLATAYRFSFGVAKLKLLESHR